MNRDDPFTYANRNSAAWTVRLLSLSLLMTAIATAGVRPSGMTLSPTVAERIRAAYLPTSVRLRAWQHVEDFSEPLAQFQSVFWEPLDTVSLRRLIRETPAVRGKTVLEIGTGTGLLAICCLRAGAAKVVATDVNPAAIANARYNAEQLGVADRLETRLVPLNRPSAYPVLGYGERFDVIMSNPPWENHRPRRIDDYALFDEGYRLLHSLLDELPQRLKPGGHALLAYGCTDAIRELLRRAQQNELTTDILDDRSLAQLPKVFLPGMLVRVAE